MSDLATAGSAVPELSLSVPSNSSASTLATLSRSCIDASSELRRARCCLNVFDIYLVVKINSFDADTCLLYMLTFECAIYIRCNEIFCL